jgi:hypothetical protein
MFASVVGKVGCKEIGGLHSPLFICENCEIVVGDEGLRSLLSLSSGHVTIYSPNAANERRKFKYGSNRREKFFDSFDLSSSSYFEIKHDRPYFFIEVYLSELDFNDVLPDLNRALDSNILQFHVYFRLPYEGCPDGSGEPFSLNALNTKESVYFLGLPSMQLVQQKLA